MRELELGTKYTQYYIYKRSEWTSVNEQVREI